MSEAVAMPAATVARLPGLLLAGGIVLILAGAAMLPAVDLRAEGMLSYAASAAILGGYALVGGSILSRRD